MDRTLLDRGLQYLHMMEAGHSPDGQEVDRASMLERYLDTTSALALQADDDPAARAELAEYMNESAPVLMEFRHRLDDYIRRTTAIMDIGFQADEWIDVSKRRSAIEFLTELSKGTPFEFGASSLDTLELDSRMMEVGDHEGYLSADRIPAGTPPSHWWWWYPNPPPESE